LDQEAPFISILYVDAFSVDVGVQPPGMDSVPLTVIFRLSVTFIPWTDRLTRTVVLTGISGPMVIFGDEGVLKYTTLEVVPNTGVPEMLPVPYRVIVVAFASVRVPVSVNTPFCKVSEPLTVSLFTTVTPAGLLMVRPVNFVLVVPPMFCGVVPFSVVVVFAGLKVPLLMKSPPKDQA
jgi:hypothetical protein